MGFFKDFKEDLSQAVNELLPDEDMNQEDNKNNAVNEEEMINTLDTDESIQDQSSDSQKMKELLDVFTQDDNQEEAVDTLTEELIEDYTIQDDNEDTMKSDAEDSSVSENTVEKEDEEENMDDNVDLELLEAMNSEEETAKEDSNQEKAESKLKATAVARDDEVTVISKGTTINGSISTDGSLDVMGTITGDIECLGKLTITGKVMGNSSASEVYVNTERLQGSIMSEGSVKVGLGTVVVGDVTATSGVIAGAIKGEIDVNGPIVIDSTAIIKGNIKAKSVQINNGAVIEGFCSLSYANVDVDNIFE